jgi:hypothetical protein
MPASSVLKLKFEESSAGLSNALRQHLFGETLEICTTPRRARAYLLDTYTSNCKHHVPLITVDCLAPRCAESFKLEVKERADSCSSLVFLFSCAPALFTIDKGHMHHQSHITNELAGLVQIN